MINTFIQELLLNFFLYITHLLGCSYFYFYLIFPFFAIISDLFKISIQEEHFVHFNFLLMIIVIIIENSNLVIIINWNNYYFSHDIVIIY